MSEKTTNVVGYYNQNKWPVNIDVSSLNLKLELQPNEYIKDRSGNNINDPIFEAYVSSGGLGKEISESAVTLNEAPRTEHIRPPNSNSVTQAESFVTHGRKAYPIYPEKSTQPAPARVHQAENKGSIISMTRDQAEKMGFAKSVKEVPFDYGADVGSTDQAIPEISYSRDSRSGLTQAQLAARDHAGINTEESTQPVVPKNAVMTQKSADMVENLKAAAKIDDTTMVFESGAPVVNTETLPQSTTIAPEASSASIVDAIPGQVVLEYQQQVKPVVVPAITVPSLEQETASQKLPEPTLPEPTLPEPSLTESTPSEEPTLTESTPSEEPTLTESTPSEEPTDNPAKLESAVKSESSVAGEDVKKPLKVSASKRTSKGKGKRKRKKSSGYPCPKCKFVGGYKYYLKAHLKDTHPDENAEEILSAFK